MTPYDKNEYKLLNIYNEYTRFFSDESLALDICAGFADWDKHSISDWELEYGYLFYGMDADREIPLWASVSKDEKVLLNQTTLEVIKFYHSLGYEPSWIDGNPPDYIGEQFRFLSYLTAGICHNIKVNTDCTKLIKERERFIGYYVLDTVKMIYDAVKTNGAFQGFIDYLDEMLRVLSDENYTKDISTDLNEFQDILDNGLNDVISDEDPYVINTGGLNNCGGKCVIRPTVQEGCMLKISSDCSSNSHLIRACVRGRGYRKTFLSSGRLRYPMKRVGERGSGKFKRISWEEAAGSIAKKWVDIRENYSPEAMYVNYATGVTGIMSPNAMIKRLLSIDGGYLGYFNSYSSACVSYMEPYIFGTKICGNSAKDVLNTKLLILWGDNPAETVFGPEKSYYLSQLRDKGIKVIVIDPRQSQTAVSFADQWIGLRPTTDSALIDAMSYVIWSENLQNQKFMDTYCLGFDEEHMPEGVPAGESYHSYIFGNKDGVVKTPEWASKITGVDADVIRNLAIEYATAKPACILAGLGAQRHGNGEQSAKSISVLSCMTGNIGIPGGGVGTNSATVEHNRPALFTNTIENPYPGLIPVFLWTKAIEHGTDMTPRGDRLTGVDHLNSNIKMMFNLAGNTLINQHSNINDTKRILKDETKCELIVCSDLFMTPSMRYADILLPATSVFEGNNIVSPWRGDNYLLRNNQCIKPLFGCRYEWEWIKEVAKNLGLYEELTEGKPDLEQWLEENYNALREIEKELPEYDEFCKAGGWQYKEQIDYIAFEDEINDPENHPFGTPSGKIEVFSKQLYDFNQEDIPAIPRYIPCPEGPDDDLKDKYPLQLIGWHTRRRCHSIHDNNEWQDEIEMPGLWIHPEDAAERGINQGETVEIINDRGKIRVPAIVTKRIVKGVVAMSQGGWYTPDKNGTDTRGSINVLTSTKYPTPLAKGNPQHTNLVEVKAL